MVKRKKRKAKKSGIGVLGNGALVRYTVIKPTHKVKPKRRAAKSTAKRKAPKRRARKRG
jgi:hypothetical protein